MVAIDATAGARSSRSSMRAAISSSRPTMEGALRSESVATMLRLSASSRCSRRSTASCEATAALRLASATFSSSPSVVELAFQPLDGMVGGAVVARDEARLEFGAERLHAPLEAFDGRIDRRVLAAGERRLDAAAEFGDAHFEPLDGARAVVGFERPPERRRLPRRARRGGSRSGLLRASSSSRVEIASVRASICSSDGWAALCSTMPRSDARSARMAVSSERSSGFSADSASMRRARSKVAPWSWAPVRLSAGHLFGQRGEVGAQRRHGGRQRLLVAAHGQRLGALVEHALVRRDFGDGRGEVVAPWLGSAALRACARSAARCRAARGSASRLLMSLSRCSMRAIWSAVAGAAARLPASRGWMRRALASSMRASSPRSAASMVAARSPALVRPGLRPLGKQGVEPRADVVQRRPAPRARGVGALAHPGDAPVEVADGLGHAGDVGGRRTGPAARCPSIMRAGTFVGILDVAGELLDHCGNPLQGAVGPPTFRLTGEALLDLVEAPDEVRNRCARPCRPWSAGGWSDGRGPRRSPTGWSLSVSARAAGLPFADGVVQPLVDGEAGASCRRVDGFARFLVDPPEAPRHARFHRSTPRRGAGGRQNPPGSCRDADARKGIGACLRLRREFVEHGKQAVNHRP